MSDQQAFKFEPGARGHHKDKAAKYCPCGNPILLPSSGFELSPTCARPICPLLQRPGIYGRGSYGANLRAGVVMPNFILNTNADKVPPAEKGELEPFRTHVYAIDLIHVLVALPGLEPGLFALRGRRVNQLHHNATLRMRAR